MDYNQLLIMLILLATLVLFIWGRWRHDMVAGGALLACVLGGLIDAEDAFTGFAHPAVVTVACVLVLSRSLQVSGAVDILVRQVLPKEAGTTLSLAALTGLGAFLSGFMNNVGAMALLMPVAVQLASRLGLTPGQVLMPLSFGTILGGMTTLIGTPPNLIVSGFRHDSLGQHFSMFDFTAVGLSVALVCILFITLPGWRLVPARHQPGSDGFDTGAYITEVR
ncbi:SLC13 family permease [Marinobacterium weihaiense]|uniref:SLC13 family permease n=1 Tax=Marinobacterium weihaiense TaxID=2851016 RepID=UPI0020B6E38C|nr:SLC13 family permease [Marinobacterium weihaiense]